MKTQSKAQKLGWIAVGFSILITSFWAFWGAGETFHEGWYYESFLKNVGLTLIQYLSSMLIFMAVGVASIYWPRVGGRIHIVVAVLADWFFNIFTNTIIIFILLPLIAMGLFYWFGSPPPRKTALHWMIGLPLLVMLVAGSVPAYRVSQRIKDRSTDAQIVAGNGVTLTWAPTGPGWPQEGKNWQEATEICRFLEEDGKTLSSEPQNIWRLPTVDEAFRSMALHGENS